MSQSEKKLLDAYLIFSLNVCGIIGNSFCYTKVNQLQRVVDKDEIGRFEIRMHDFQLMYSSYCLQHLDLSRIRSSTTLSVNISIPYLLPIVT